MQRNPKSITHRTAIDNFVDEIMSLPLAPKTKEDALKVLHCLQYIRDNIEVITKQIQQGKFASERDQGNQVLRDDWGTSFHVDGLKNLTRERIIFSFQEQIARIEEVVSKLTLLQRNDFAILLNYQEDSGCLNQRLGAALGYADQALATPPILQLDTILTLCSLYARYHQSTLMAALQHYCKTRNISECYFNHKLTPITDDLFNDYIKEVLSEDPLIYPAVLSQTEIQTAYHKLLAATQPRLLLGKTGMVQFHFTNSADAERFVAWLKNQTNLESLNIHKARSQPSVVDGKTVFIVRLTSEQYDFLTGMDGYELLTPTYQPETKQPTNKNVLQLVASIRKAISLNDFNEITNFVQKLDGHDPELLNKVFTAKSSRGFTLLHEICYAAAGPFLTALLPKISQQAFDTAMLTNNNKGWNVLHYAVLKIDDKNLAVFLAKASPNAFDAALYQVTSKGQTPLLIAAGMNDDRFLQLITKASSAALENSLSTKQVTYENALSVIFSYQPTTPIKLLVEKISPNTLETCINAKNVPALSQFKYYLGNLFPRRAMPLHYLACYQQEAAFIAVINNLSSASVSEQTNFQMKDEWTLLKVVIKNQSTLAATTFLNKVTPTALNSSLQFNPEILALALNYHPEPFIFALLSKFDPNTLKNIVNAKLIPNSAIIQLTGYLIHEPTWQTPTMLDKFCCLEQVLTEKALNAWMLGKKLSTAIYQTLARYLSAKSAHTDLEKDWLDWWQHAEDNVPLPLGMITITTGKNKQVDVNDPHLEDIIWEQGLKSYSDYRVLSQHKNSQAIKERLHSLVAAKCLKQGCTVNYQHYLEHAQTKHYIEAFQTLLSKNSNSSILIKTIKDKDWDFFLKQINDYKHRPALRSTKMRKTDTHKFVHLKNQVVPYQKHKAPKYKPAPNYTKKLPATLLSSELRNGIFGDSERNSNLVGILLDVDHVIFKAFLSADRGTFYRRWVGSEKEVQQYAEGISAINFTDFASFKAYIEKNPQQLNEVLVKISREAILGIVITQKSPEAHAIARQRQVDLEKILHRTVPIVYIDRAVREFKLYPLEAIKAHDANQEISFIKEAECKSRALSIKAELEGKVKTAPAKFFAPVSDHQTVPPTKTAEKILKIIAEAEQSTSPTRWSNADEKIATLLSARIANNVSKNQNDGLYAGIRQRFYAK